MTSGRAGRVPNHGATSPAPGIKKYQACTQAKQPSIDVVKSPFVSPFAFVLGGAYLKMANRLS